MKRFLVILLSVMTLLTTTTYGQSKERSSSVVYINGSRYYVHTVVAGDTLYSLSRIYGLTDKEIFEANPILGEGLRVGTNIKIPYTAEPPKKAVSVKKLRKTFDTHKVEKGETLYSISRKYALSVDILMEDNANLDPAALTLGQELQIRKTEQGQTSEEETLEEIDNYTKRLNSVAPDGFKYYIVESGESVEAIALKFEMSEEQLRRANNLPRSSNSFSSGSMILVRDGDSEMATEAYTAEKKIEREERMESVSFSMLSHRDTLNVALLLPLSVKGRVMKPFAEFYQGFLLGVEDLKRLGRNVNVNLYNTERDSAAVRRIISQQSYQSCNLIVGPVYEQMLDIVLLDAEQRSIPVVSPLATLKKSDSPLLFQMAPDVERRYDKIGDILSEERRVTVIKGVSNDSDFEVEVQKLLASRNVIYDEYEYEYEHPTTITERERDAEEAIKRLRTKMEEEMGAAFTEELMIPIVDSLTPPISKSDLTPLIMGEIKKDESAESDEVVTTDLYTESDDKPKSADEIIDMDVAATASEESTQKSNEPIFHTFFVTSDNEIEVDRILSALSSAYAAQLAMNRGSGRKFREHIQYQVVANPEWRRYNNIDRTIYFRDRVVSFSSYLASRESKVVREFDSRYCESYDEMPSLYSYRGYDAAKIFGEGLFSDIMYNMGGRTYQPLQSKYRFERDDNRACIVNTNWMKEVYNTNFTKTVE